MASSGKAKVRCTECHWEGSRKSDAPDGTPLEKPCPNGHEAVVVGGPPPSNVDTTPSGIEIAFWDSINIETGQKQQRRYRVNGEKFPSVTTILGILDKPGLLFWVERLTREGEDWREVRDQAAERGVELHHLLLQVLLGERFSLGDLPDEWRAWGQAGLRWVRDAEPKVIETERMVASLEHEYSGRFDLLADVDGVRTLVDFKTVTSWSYDDEAQTKLKPPYPENLLQLDLYQGALIESGFEPAEQGLIVRLGPDGVPDETFVELAPARGLRIIPAYETRSIAAGVLRDARRELVAA